MKKLELGLPNTRAAGMVREDGGVWRYPTIEDNLVMLTERVVALEELEKRVVDLEGFQDAARTRLRTGAISHGHNR